MKRVAFLSCENLDGYVVDDSLLVEPLKRAGWEVSFVPWEKKGTNWSDYAAVVIRTPWNYTEHTARFIEVLREISSKTLLLNSLSTVLWNIDKSYLLDLQKKGLPVIPTRIEEKFSMNALAPAFEAFSCEELILKPVVSACARSTYRFSKKTSATEKAEIEKDLNGRRVLIQPFFENILSEGELSFFFFNKKISHVAQKQPKDKDFRVQEEHGGMISSILNPSPPDIRVAQSFVDAVPEDLLYARVDLVRDGSENLRLMELELIEPSLYLRTHPKAPANFVDAFQRKMARP